MNFTVEPGTLVNLGTALVILDGEPHESLRSGQDCSRGTCTYRYRYERDPGESAYSGPLKWFTEKKSKIAVSFGDRVVREDSPLTDAGDGSKVFLKQIVPRVDR